MATNTPLGVANNTNTGSDPMATWRPTEPDAKPTTAVALIITSRNVPNALIPTRSPPII